MISAGTEWIAAGIVCAVAGIATMILRGSRLDVAVAILLLLGGGFGLWQGLQIARVGARVNRFILDHPQFVASPDPVYLFRWHGARWFVAFSDPSAAPALCEVVSPYLLLEVRGKQVAAWDSPANVALVDRWLVTPSAPSSSVAPSTLFAGRLPADITAIAALSCSASREQSFRSAPTTIAVTLDGASWSVVGLTGCSGDGRHRCALRQGSGT